MTITLDQLLSPREEATFVHSRVGELMILDGLTANRARRVVRQRIEEGDAMLLAAEGQVWSLRPEFASLADWPRGRELEVIKRLAFPPAVVVADETGAERELGIAVLGEMYELTEWRWEE